MCLLTIDYFNLFETAGGVQFRAGESIEVKGTAEVLVSCVTAGAAGNVAASTVTAMPVQIAGISAVTNPEPMTGGYDAESDKSLMERFLNQLQHPATSGNAWHYSEWAHEVAGVGEVIGHGAGTVDVTVLGSDGKAERMHTGFWRRSASRSTRRSTGHRSSTTACGRRAS
ncbi:MAG: baseplate J/gp47 family protein [Clostridiaceae bacterium]|nr:baseplate J/gp47 family protein [Clostridiaceae bacterium]